MKLLLLSYLQYLAYLSLYNSLGKGAPNWQVAMAEKPPGLSIEVFLRLRANSHAPSAGATEPEPSVP